MSRKDPAETKMEVPEVVGIFGCKKCMMQIVFLMIWVDIFLEKRLDECWSFCLEVYLQNLQLYGLCGFSSALQR